MNSPSLRQKIYRLWVKNPYTKAKEICSLINLPYKKHQNYVNKMLSEFRSYHKFGLPLKPLNFPHKRVFVWENVPRAGFEPLKFGWLPVSNRNGMFVFRDEMRGSVHWYPGGKVVLYARGEVSLARVKELFCRAFSFMGFDDWSRYLDGSLKEESKHWVFEMGVPVPQFDIRKFERSHGLRIYADGSHPTAIEVAESSPYWLDRLERVQDQFAENLKTHLEVEGRTLKIVKGIEKVLGISKPRRRRKKVPWEI